MPHGGCFEENGGSERDATELPDARDQKHGQKRVTAKLEEVVVDPNWTAQDLLPDPGELELQRIPGWAERLRKIPHRLRTKGHGFIQASETHAVAVGSVARQHHLIALALSDEGQG